MIIAGIIAILIPIAFLYMTWALEVYAFNRSRVLFASFGWGIAAFIIAYLTHGALISAGIVDRREVSLAIAPVLEEILKALGLFYLVRRALVRYAADGASYGFAIGTGFAVCENLFYLSNTSTAPVDLAIVRTLSTSLMHAFTTSFVGAVLGSNAFKDPRLLSRRGLVILVVAMLLHFGFNLTVDSLNGTLMVLAAITIGLTGTAVNAYTINRSLREEREWLTSQLGELPPGEQAVVLNPTDVSRLIEQNRHTIGFERADMLQAYIRLIAQRALLRKALDLTVRESYRRSLSADLETTDRTIRQLQRDMGLYSRAWLRTLLPSEESDQWTLLEQELKHDQPLLELMSVLSARQAILSPAALSARRDLVRSVRLFSTLEEDEVEDIASLMELYTAGVGSVIFNQGDSENRLFVVHDGRLVASSRDAHDNDMILTSYGPGDTFGILSLLDQQPQQNTVTAVTDCQIYTLRREDLLTLLTAKPAVGLEMMKHLATIIRRRTALLAWVQQGSNRATQPDDIALLQSEVGPFVLDSLPDPDTSAS